MNRKLIGCFMLCLSIVMVVLGFTIFRNKSNDIVSIVEDLTISSTVQNAITQECISDISGKIRNNTDKDLFDIKLRINVETSFLHNKGSFDIFIEKIIAKSEISIKKSFESKENFETVLSIEAYIGEEEVIMLEKQGVSFFVILGILLCGISIAILSLRSKDNLIPEK